MDYGELLPKVMDCLELLKIHKKLYQSGVNGGVLLHHFISVEHGLRLFELLHEVSDDKNLTQHIYYLVPHIKQKLYSLSYLRKDESMLMKVDHEYADLREQMQNIVINPRINKHHVYGVCFSLLEILKELVSSDCKADQLSPVRKELEDIRNMLYLLEPFAEHFASEEAWDKPFTDPEEGKRILSTVATVMDKVTCFLHFSAVGKMDDEMVLSLKDSYSDLIIEETRIMKMYLILDVDSAENLESHVSMSLRLLQWNKRCFLGTELGEALEDHFTSIDQGLQYLIKILKVSKNEDFKLRVQRLINIVKQKLYSLPQNQYDENLKVNLSLEYGELREEMKNVVMKPGTDDFDTLFPEVLYGYDHLFDEIITELTSLKSTSNSKASQIALMMKKLEMLKNKLTSLSSFNNPGRPVTIKFNVALISFLDRATCLMYLSFIAKLNDFMVVSLRKKFSSLIEGVETKITHSLKLLKIHRKSCQRGVNGVILLHHCMSLEHGLQFLDSFFEFSEDEDLIDGIGNLVYHVKQKLYSLTHLRQDESLVVKLEQEYVDLREQIKNVIIKPGINKHHIIFPKHFSYSTYKKTSLFLSKIIEELVSSDCKADHISPVMKELEYIKKMLFLLGPFFKYAKHLDYEEPWEKPFSKHEEEKKILSTVAAVMERVTCFIYFSAVGKMDDEMVLYLKNSSSYLIIKEPEIMKMYLSLHVNSIENLKSHISMSLRLLEFNKTCYLGRELGDAQEDHLTSIENGLQCLYKILKISKNGDFKLRVQRLIVTMKQKLYSLPYNQNDENLKVNLELAYGGLREEMKNVVIRPGSDDYDTLFSKVLNGDDHLYLEQMTELTSSKLTSSSKGDQIAPMMKEIKELRKKLASLEPLFDYARTNFWSLPTCKPEEIEVNVALTSFLDRATCLIYLSFIANLNEDMVISLKKDFSLLIEKTDEIKQMAPVLGIIFEDDLESDIDISLSLLKRHQEYHIYTINEAILEDHIISLKNGIEFLKWFFNIYNFDEDLKRCIILFAGNVNQQLKFLTYKLERMLHIVDLNMDVIAAYGALREEMKNVIINQIADKYGSRFPEAILENYQFDSRLEKTMKAYLKRNYDFLFEKITTLVTSNCKADQISPLKKELHDLEKRLQIFKPLGLYICGIPWPTNIRQNLKTLLTFHHKAIFLICLTFVETMDTEMVLLVKSSISIAIEETDAVQEIYTEILNEFLSEGEYDVKELNVLPNLMTLLESNGESLNDANIKLHEVLMDIHSFLLALPQNVILRKLHLLKKSLEGIFRQSIPIIYSCYLVLTEIDISAELNCVLDLIKHIKSEAVQMKVYYYPAVDDLGFLEFFLGYLEDLMKDQEILMEGEIDALYTEVDTLLSLAKSTNQDELHKNPWNDIMNLAYQAEYVIDLYLVSSPRDLEFISSLSKIIQQLRNSRADVNDSVNLDLSRLYKSLPTQNVLGKTTQLTENDAIVGLQEETKNITDYLLTGESKVDVVTIIGMAGVGKTTLAFTLYNTPSMANYFDICAWCAVSQSYQIRALLLSILDQVDPIDKSDRSEFDDEELAERLCKSLKKRRYLMALDDVWDTALWNYLKHYLPDDRNGSRILITTRNRDVADHIGSKVNELHELSEENSWELFQKKMVEKERLSIDLLNISKGIVSNCKGLPLSIIIIAGILSSIERTEKKWNQIAKSVSSLVLSDPQGNCKAILELSYNNLSNHLRSCFLYLGSFPEDQEILVNRLILLWIGEGFVQDTEIDTAEEVAKKYVEDLIVKSLVIPAKKRSGGGVKTFRLHDLLRDFCLDKAREKNFFTLLGNETFEKINPPPVLEDPRRIIENWYDYPPIDFSCHSVRSLIIRRQVDAFEFKKGIGSFDMVLLKVLEVDEVCSKIYPIDDGDDCSNHFPDISSLVHLRYLAFRGQDFWSPCFYGNFVLPPSISKLQNLQILILRFGKIKVPDFIWDMVKLRHFHTDGASIEVDSNRLQNSSCLLRNLKSLSNVQVSHSDSKWLSKLLGLERLSCVFVEVDDVTEVSDDIVVDDVTEVEDTKTDDVTEVNAKDNQFQMLSFNGTLISLKVANDTGYERRFISISTFQLPKSLRKLSLSNFYLKSNNISTIGQTLTQLEVFKIYSCDAPSGCEWVVDDEDFPELKVLKLRILKISKWIASENSFPRLEQLWVEDCHSLDEIPIDFGSLPNLRLITVKGCPSSVDNSARQIEKMQHEEQNTEMRVLIYSEEEYSGFDLREEGDDLEEEEEDLEEVDADLEEADDLVDEDDNLEKFNDVSKLRFT